MAGLWHFFTNIIEHGDTPDLVRKPDLKFAVKPINQGMGAINRPQMVDVYGIGFPVYAFRCPCHPMSMLSSILVQSLLLMWIATTNGSFWKPPNAMSCHVMLFSASPFGSTCFLILYFLVWFYFMLRYVVVCFVLLRIHLFIHPPIHWIELHHVHLHLKRFGRV